MNSFTSYRCVYKIGCVYVHVYITTYTSLASQLLPPLIPSHKGAKGLVSRLCKFCSTALEIVCPIRSEGISNGRGWLARLNLYIVPFMYQRLIKIEPINPQPTYQPMVTTDQLVVCVLYDPVAEFINLWSNLWIAAGWTYTSSWQFSDNQRRRAQELLDKFSPVVTNPAHSI